MEKKEYNNVNIDVIMFNKADVLTASSNITPEENEGEIMPG